jgi:hypothetical protein
VIDLQLYGGNFPLLTIRSPHFEGMGQSGRWGI